MKRNIERGFTFAELMVSLVVIAVITAILYPTISELAPNNNKHLFKSAYKTVEMVISDISATTNNLFPADAKGICEEFEKRLNVLESKCTASPYTLTSSNGMRWLFRAESLTGATTTGTAWIIVDVNAANNKINSRKFDIVSSSSSPSSSSSSVAVPADVWNKGSFIGNETTTDTFGIQVQLVDGVVAGKTIPAGKIIGVSAQAKQHLTEVSPD